METQSPLIKMEDDQTAKELLRSFEMSVKEKLAVRAKEDQEADAEFMQSLKTIEESAVGRRSDLEDTQKKMHEFVSHLEEELRTGYEDIQDLAERITQTAEEATKCRNVEIEAEKKRKSLVLQIRQAEDAVSRSHFLESLALELARQRHVTSGRTSPMDEDVRN